jgi:chromosome segregation ATPase
LNTVNREVEHLKAELRDQDRRLAELASERVQENTASATATTTTVAQGYSVVTRTMSNSSEESGDSLKRLERLGDENQRLRKENAFLSRELNEFKGSNSDLAELHERLHCCEHEISRAKETIVCMKSERKKLRGEKMELLNQMKQVYGILEDKESELREFIKNYEQQMTSSDIKIKQLLSEKENWVHERKNSLQYIDDLSNKLRTKETHLTVVESELLEVKQRLTLLRVNIPQQGHTPHHGETNNLNISNSSRFSRAIQADVEKLLHVHATGEYDNLSKSAYSTAGKF